jgi:Raf kinase inhibitor-like YbhB/YbcL family protein
MEESTKFILESSDLKEGEYIQEKFTPQGSDLIPNLCWRNVPDKTKSLALCVEDPDAPNGTFYHWLVMNIPHDKTFIDNNNVQGKEVVNSWGQTKYKGPSPPGKHAHRYFFKLFALSVDKINAHDIDSFLKEVEKNKIDEASLMVKYKRPSHH